MSQVIRSPIWVSKFNDEALAKFYEEFTKAENDRELGIITIYISSYGGQVHNLLAMRDLIKSSNKPVSTVAIGKAMSAGAFLLAAGTKGYRFACPNADIMVHEVQSFLMGSLGEINEQHLNLKKMNNSVMKQFADDTGKSVSFWKNKIQQKTSGDVFLTAQEAKACGIVDQVKTPRLVIETDSKTSLYGM